MILPLSTIIIVFLFELCKQIIKKNKPIIISIDGNIGSGKSTLIQILKKNMLNYSFIDEPIESWTNITDENNKNVLAHFYEDKKRWSYTFQNYAFLTRSKVLLQFINNDKKNTMLEQIISLFRNVLYGERKIYFTERSTKTDRYVFADMLYTNGYMNLLEWKMYKEWYTLFSDKLTINNVIYIKTDPQISFTRVNKRSRTEEKTISLDYLTELHNKHEEWLNGDTHVLTLDGNLEFEKDINNQNEIINNINTYINNIKQDSSINLSIIGNFIINTIRGIALVPY